MAPTSSDNVTLPPPLRRQLLELAGASIRRGLSGDVLTIELAEFAPPLRAHRASFVTLHLEENLRGCIGSLEAERPLVEDVVRNARSAAFDDPRFPALTGSEFERVSIHISLLNPPEPLTVFSEEELLAKLRPGVDGLILSCGRHRGTFLPSVWDVLPEPREFVRHLKLKAGLSPDYWSDAVRVLRYTTESVT